MTCGERASEPKDLAPLTEYEQQRRRIVDMAPRLRDLDYQPEPWEFVIAFFGGDPWTEPGLYLCRSCGVTRDEECSYGGWHGDGQRVAITLDGGTDET